MGEARASADLVRGFYEAFNRGDWEDIERHWQPDLIFHELPYAPDAGTYRGYEGLRRFVDKIADALDDVRYEIQDLAVNGDRVLVSVRMTARGHDTGIDVDLRLYSVYEVRDGRLARHRAFMDREEAVEATGLEAA